MSLATCRAEIAAALSLIDGVTGYAAPPTTPKTGDAWPMLSFLDRDQPSGAFYVNWRILVALPQDEAAASAWIDEHCIEVVDGIEQTVGYVDRVEPVLRAASGGDQYALQFTMRGE